MHSTTLKRSAAGGRPLQCINVLLKRSTLARTFVSVSRIRSSTTTRRAAFSTSSEASATNAEQIAPAAVATTPHISKPSHSYMSAAALAALSLSIGFALGRTYQPQDTHTHTHSNLVLPNGLPRTCCDEAPPAPEHQALLTRLVKIVGPENVLRGDATPHTRSFLQGARIGGGGTALAIVTPRRLDEIVPCVKAIVEAECVVLPQGQNTGLTGGSVPRVPLSESTSSTKPTRPVVVLSMKYLDGLFPLDDGKRILCFPGVGLARLQQFLDQEFPDRESHSVLGSTFLNPTTAAGIAFGSGGTQLRKGPAYTERALYFKVGDYNKWNEHTYELVDTLGIQDMSGTDEDPRYNPSDITVANLDHWNRVISGGYAKLLRHSEETGHGQLPASDVTYAERVCQLEGLQGYEVSRCNADTRGPDCNRSEGKVIILATIHDTFPKPQATKSFWIGFDSLETALLFRKHVCLNNPKDLPISLEYMDRDSFDVVNESGRILGNVICLIGTTSPWMRRLWNVKLFVEALPFSFAPTFPDKVLYWLNPLCPPILPSRIMKTGKRMDHHVAMTVGEFGDGNMERMLQRMEAFVQEYGADKVVVHECTSAREATTLTAFRFVSASAFRTWCVGQGVQGISIDYALPKNNGQAPQIHTKLAQPIKRMRYSHFGCNVVHEDLAYGPEVDVHQAKHDIKHIVEAECYGKLPAEHGHGTEYVAPPETQARWKRMDPLNVCNPGIGGSSEHYKYES
jgi:D-lactate dehydrogenase (quinone)